MSERLLSHQDLQFLLSLPASLRFAHILALNAKPVYANCLNVVELMAWLADPEVEVDRTLLEPAASSRRIPASSGEAA
jgi:hypothetical protein